MKKKREINIGGAFFLTNANIKVGVEISISSIFHPLNLMF